MKRYLGIWMLSFVFSHAILGMQQTGWPGQGGGSPMSLAQSPTDQQQNFFSQMVPSAASTQSPCQAQFSGQAMLVQQGTDFSSQRAIALNQQVMQSIKLLWDESCMKTIRASEAFQLSMQVEELKRQLENAQKRLGDFDYRQTDPEDAHLNRLAELLDHGGSLQGFFSQSDVDRSVLLHLRERACAHSKAIILEKLLEVDQGVRKEMQQFGLSALTDDAETITESTDKMNVLVQAGIVLANLRSSESELHAIVRTGKKEVVEAFVQKNPTVLMSKDRNGRTLWDIACKRYEKALYENGRRDGESEDAFKILQLFYQIQKRGQEISGKQ